MAPEPRQKLSDHPLLAGLLLHLRGRLLAGLLLVVPLAITYLVLRFLFAVIDGLLQPVVRQALGRTIPGLGVVLLALVIYLAGLVAANYVGRWLIHLGQNFLLRIPLVKTVYSAAKQLIESFSGTAHTGFKRVVLLEYPRRDSWALGFLTGITKDEEGNTLAIVYIPTAPTPNTGWVAILPLEEVYDTDLTIQEAMSMVFSGGILTPAEIKKRVPARGKASARAPGQELSQGGQP